MEERSASHRFEAAASAGTFSCKPHEIKHLFTLCGPPVLPDKRI